MQSATTAALTAEAAFIKSRAFQGLRDADEKRLSAIRAARDTAEVDYQSMMRRRDAITEFCKQIKGYRNAHDDAERHLFLLRWMQPQIPLIECESTSVGSGAVEAGCGLNSEPLRDTVAKNFEGSQSPGTPCPAVGGSATLADWAGARHGKLKRSSCEAVSVHRRSKRTKFTNQDENRNVAEPPGVCPRNRSDHFAGAQGQAHEYRLDTAKYAMRLALLNEQYRLDVR